VSRESAVSSHAAAVAEPGPPVFTAQDVGFGYGGAFRLDLASFEVREGEILGLVGPNSSGKTTLLRLLSKVHAPGRGEIRFRGRPLDVVSRVALAREVAVVPQEEQLAFSVTVEELTLMGRYPRGAGRLFEGAEDLVRAREAMTLAGVLDLADQPVDTLAGGERQRVLLARALAQEPCVLLLDEPTSHLDLLHQRHLVGLLRRLNRDRGITVVFVSHDLNLAGELADRLLLVSGGRIVRLGPPEEVLDEAVLEAAYGCPVWVERLVSSGRPVVLGVRL
jgi:ABC-type cobalamin/Fe3+-siderophores transport system ATPase subunit